MNILAFDTSFAAVSACVRVDGQVRAWRHVATARGHAEILLPMVADVLAEAGLAASSIACVATVRGPGHFTGLRGGIAAAQGFAQASGARLVGFDAFAVVAAQMGVPGAQERRLIVFDSKRAEAFFQLDGQVPGAVKPVDFAPTGDAFLVGGDVAAVFAERLRALGKAARIDPGESLPDARTLAALAESSDPVGGPLLPLYIHPPATTVPKAQ
ncbi:MAG: tRNA (adenosine(37)-N6)-threonylcarbamoyltransferase complex dimerization subunit type 1 TsaB [Telmatospirillum sp.]|nr:tRNA (adenosine(37)-N6)-threonylcarbamoyltransferase complex dimerization subunit type 1 TsaB [Telmatospirillum sp.]